MRSLETQKRVLIIAAKVVQKFGDTYLPILDRAELEYENAQRAATAQDRASQILERLKSA